MDYVANAAEKEKKMIKKIIASIIALSVILMCGCSSNTPTKDNDKLKIVTTIFPAYDFARQVFGDTADITLLLKPGTESHTFDPGARDIVSILDCDLFIYNGGESDVWVENILESDDSKSLNTLRMMDSVEALEEEHIEGAEEHEHHDGEEEEYDEHIWTSPKNSAKIVASVRDAAIKLNPENSALYEQSANSYIAEINDLDSRFSRLLANERRYFIFGDRFPLLYFFKEYDLNYYAAFPGCGSETEPSAQMIAFLTEKLKQEDSVKTVFYIELSNHKLSDTLAKDTGVSTAEFHTCHNITADDFQAGETYVSLMERNYRMLEGVLA